MKKIIKYLKNPKLIFLYLSSKNCFKWMRDETCIKLLYYSAFGKKLNLENPVTFNEKLQWLKLYDRNPKYTTIVDKYEVKKYVANIIGEEYIIPTLGVYDRFEEINFDKLPNQFVIKCTHDSGGVVICKNKNELNMNEARKKINKSLKNSYFYLGREWPYKDVKPRIIIEKYMTNELGEELNDYKFFAFNGVVKCFKVDFDRYSYHQANYYDTNKNLLYFGEKVCPPNFDKIIEFPNNLNKMIEISEKLSKISPFLRVDLYNVNEKIYFGELTFYPACGYGEFTDEEWDYKLGSWINLPKRKERNEK